MSENNLAELYKDKFPAELGPYFDVFIKDQNLSPEEIQFLKDIEGALKFEHESDIRRTAHEAAINYFNEAPKTQAEMLAVANAVATGSPIAGTNLGEENSPQKLADNKKEQERQTRLSNALIVAESIRHAQMMVKFDNIMGDVESSINNIKERFYASPQVAREIRENVLFIARTDKFTENHIALIQDAINDPTNTEKIQDIKDNVTAYGNHIDQMIREQQISKVFKEDILDDIDDTLRRMEPVVDTIIDRESRKIAKDLIETIKEKQRLENDPDANPEDLQKLDGQIQGYLEALQKRAADLEDGSPAKEQMERLFKSGEELTRLRNEILEQIKQLNSVMNELEQLKEKVAETQAKLDEIINCKDPELRKKLLEELEELNTQKDGLLNKSKEIKEAIETNNEARQQIIIDELNAAAKTQSVWSSLVDGNISGAWKEFKSDAKDLLINNGYEQAAETIAELKTGKELDLSKQTRTFDFDGDGTTETKELIPAIHSGFYYYLDDSGVRHYPDYRIQKILQNEDAIKALENDNLTDSVEYQYHRQSIDSLLKELGLQPSFEAAANQSPIPPATDYTPIPSREHQNFSPIPQDPLKGM